MQALLDSFGSGAIATAVATWAGPVGTIVYVLIWVWLFITVASLVIYAVHRARWGSR
jgi:hypothetical protein